MLFSSEINTLSDKEEIIHLKTLDTFGNCQRPGVRSTRANDSQLFAQTFFYRLNDWCVYAMSIWRRPEMKMARTIRRFFFNFVFAAIVLFLTSLHQLINFVIPNLHYHPPKIQCNYVCDKEIIPYACPPF